VGAGMVLGLAGLDYEHAAGAMVVCRRDCEVGEVAAVCAQLVGRLHGANERQAGPTLVLKGRQGAWRLRSVFLEVQQVVG
jgi:hypothetical protein